MPVARRNSGLARVSTARFGLAPVDSTAWRRILAIWRQFTGFLVRAPGVPPQQLCARYNYDLRPEGDLAPRRRARLSGRMLAKRIVPLIVAVALFMENMDSTVIATSLPAIAADIGTSPLALKLAVTSYLLSLAVIIPVSGWTADRFGARTVFRAAIAVFMLGSIGCALSGSLSQFVVARILQGVGGAMMTPVARLILVRSIDKRELINAMVWVTLPALIGPLLGPALGGFITTYI